MDIEFIEKKETWDGLVGEIKPSQFLQIWQWGEFQRALGRGVWRVKISRGGETLALGQAIRHALPFGKCYIYFPRGPLLTPAGRNHAPEIIAELIKKIRGFAPGAIFARFETPDYAYPGLGLRRSRDVQPSHTTMLDLEKSEDELLAAMHPKTRYNILVAEKHGVAVRKMQDGEFEKFWELMGATANRDAFRPHPKEYYKKMIDSLGGEMCDIYFAEFGGKILAANFMIRSGEITTYLHGASSSEDRNTMAPYLLHWEMIKRAKADGYRYYDFWGIAPEGAPANHPWAGITRFKKGFGGIEVLYSGTRDLALDKLWYFLYKLKSR